MDRFDQLRDGHEKVKNDEAFLVDKISDESLRKHFVGSLEFKNIDLALYNIFVASDFDAARNNFYKAGLAVAYDHEKYNSEIFLIRHFLHPILSDSASLMKRFVTYDRTMNRLSFAYFFGKAIQNIVTDDFASLTTNILQLKKLAARGWPRLFSGSIAAFSGFLNNDVHLIAEGINLQLVSHPRIETIDLWKACMSFEATALTKLAYQKNYKFEVANKLVPKGLLPVKELASYKGYTAFGVEYEDRRF